ncbi:MAG: alpha/beta hydrolase [Lachnospiraceae bacterium]|jgi:enterochelin esterase-like enzyme
MRDNKKFRKGMAALLTAVTAASLFAGCGAAESSNSSASTAEETSSQSSAEETTSESSAEEIYTEPKVTTPAYTKDLEPLGHGDTSQIAETIVFGSGGGYDDTDFSVPDGYATEQEGVEYGEYITDLTYYSETAGMEKTFNIVLPAGYDESVEYPVLYLLHGYGGGPDEWNAARVVCGNLQAAGEMPACIIVQPDEWTSQNSKEDASFADWISAFAAFPDDLINDLMPYIEENYSVATGKENTAIMGLSMGGWQAIQIAFDNPGTFGYVGGLAAMIGALNTGSTGQYMNSDLSELDMEDTDDIPYYIMLAYGSEEPWCKESTDEYRESMTENGIPNAFYIIEGTGHDGNTWVPGLYNFAGRIFRN